MLIYTGGQKTGTGTYWDITNGERVEVLREEILPGSRRSIYLRMPSFAMLLLAPILGLLYVVFLPVAALLLIVGHVIKKPLLWMLGLMRRLAHFEWRASEAYLSGKKKTSKKKNRSSE